MLTLINKITRKCKKTLRTLLLLTIYWEWVCISDLWDLACLYNKYFLPVCNFRFHGKSFSYTLVLFRCKFLTSVVPARQLDENLEHIYKPVMFPHMQIQTNNWTSHIWKRSERVHIRICCHMKNVLLFRLTTAWWSLWWE